MKYLCLLRGINVGGKNKISMTELKQHLAEAGFKNITTYINSGNVIIETDEQDPDTVERSIEALLPSKFKLDSELIKIRALTSRQLEAIVNRAPEGFGTEPEKYYSDVLFPMGVPSAEIMAATETNPEVDAAWEDNGVVYYRRLGVMRTRSRLSKVISKPVYKNITIRSWNTTVKLLDLLKNP